jgi:hypothetical protein
LITALAPMVSSRLSVRSPILVIWPSRSLPPLECCRGVSPSQAEKSWPQRKVSGGRARATIAAAVTGPMPGMVISGRATGSSFARRAISRSSSTTYRRAQGLDHDLELGARRLCQVLARIFDALDQPRPDVAGRSW